MTNNELKIIVGLIFVVISYGMGILFIDHNWSSIIEDGIFNILGSFCIVFSYKLLGKLL